MSGIVNEGRNTEENKRRRSKFGKTCKDEKEEGSKKEERKGTNGKDMRMRGKRRQT